MAITIQKLIEEAGKHLHELAETYHITLKSEGKHGQDPDLLIGTCPLHPGISNTLFIYPKKGEWVCQECQNLNHIDPETRYNALDFVRTYSATADDEITTIHLLTEFAEQIGCVEPQNTKENKEWTEAQDVYQFDVRPFTDAELFLIGSPAKRELKDGKRTPEWTTEQMNDLFNLYALNSYTAPSDKERSCKYISIPSHPYFVFLYEDQDQTQYGYIYTPIRYKNDPYEKEYKPFPNEYSPRLKNELFTDNGVKGLHREVLTRKRPSLGPDENKLSHLMLCSTPIDAISAYMRTRKIKVARDPKENSEIETAVGMEKPIDVGNPEDTDIVKKDSDDRLHVCWIGNFTSYISNDIIYSMNMIATRIYLCLHQDEKGLRAMYKVAYNNIYVQLVLLPAQMAADSHGRLCSIQDYFMRFDVYRKTVTRKNYDFTLSIMASRSLKFWAPTMDKDGKPTGRYSMVNDNLMSFIAANGIYTFDYGEKTLSFVSLKGNRVTIINPEKIEKCVKDILFEYVYNSYNHYSKQLVNDIYRSKEIKTNSLLAAKQIELNFTYESKYQDFFVFQNGTVRVSRDEVRWAEESEVNFHIFENKVIPFNFERTAPLFTVSYSKEFKALLEELKATEKYSDEWHEVQNRVNAVGDIDKYELNSDFDPSKLSYMQYIYNTGKMYWRDEAKGIALNERQEKEYKLNFINKVWSIGYLLRKYKDESKPYLTYAIENDIILYGKNEGRSGKSLFFRCLKAVSKVIDVDMRNIDIKQKGDTLFSGVDRYYTDIVHLEDFQRTQSISTFFNSVTGTMAVRKLNQNVQTIPYSESPKLVVSSNSAPEGMDGSTRDRVNFIAFSSYYHAANPASGQRDFSPQMEFGKNLVIDYTKEEMNLLYNFFFNCVQMNMNFPAKISPIMDNIEKRTLIESIRQNVFDWMNDYFDQGAEMLCKVDAAIWRNDIFEDYKQAFSKSYQDKVTIQNLREKLTKYCEYRKWTLNPEPLYRSDGERQRLEYRKGRDGKDDYFWYIQTKEIPEETIEAFQQKTVVPISIMPSITPYGGETYTVPPSKKKGQEIQIDTPF